MAVGSPKCAPHACSVRGAGVLPPSCSRSYARRGVPNGPCQPRAASQPVGLCAVENLFLLPGQVANNEVTRVMASLESLAFTSTLSPRLAIW